MAEHTSNINLSKPTYSEDADIAVINSNMDIIDGKMGAVGNTSVQAQLNTASTNITNLGKELCAVVAGKQSTTGAATGEYVIVRGSTISGISDGAYIAAKTIPANTNLDSSYFSSTGMTKGIANALNANIASINSKVNSKMYDSLDYVSSGDVLEAIKNKLNSGATSGVFLAVNCTNAPVSSSTQYKIRYTRVSGSSNVTAEAFNHLGNMLYLAYFNIDSRSITWEEIALKTEISNIDPKRGNIDSVANDTYLLGLNAGTYQVVVASSSAVTNGYIPSQYGTLTVNDSGAAYKSYIFVATNGKAFYRECHKNDQTWYTEWQELALKSDLGSPTSASSITGADAFSKISTLNSNIISVSNKVIGIEQSGVGSSIFSIRFRNDANNHQMAVLFSSNPTSDGYKVRLYDVTASWSVIWSIT